MRVKLMHSSQFTINLPKVYPCTVSATQIWISLVRYIQSSVGDPDPWDLYVFRPPGSVSSSYQVQIRLRILLYHQANIVRKPFFPPVL